MKLGSTIDYVVVVEGVERRRDRDWSRALKEARYYCVGATVVEVQRHWRELDPAGQERVKEIAADTGGLAALAGLCGVTAKDARRVLGLVKRREGGVEERAAVQVGFSCNVPLVVERFGVVRRLVGEADRKGGKQGSSRA